MKNLQNLFFLILCAVNLNACATDINKFLLITGPSGVGKTTIINHLKKIDSNFVYIMPYTTRKLRDSEHDKISISKEQMENLRKNGKLLAVNKIYGIYYGTPKNVIDQQLKNKKYPIIDWPITRLEIMKKHYSSKLYVVYVQPDSKKELQLRLSKDTRDLGGQRINLGIQELKKVKAGLYDKMIDLKVINEKGRSKEVAQIIYNSFIQKK